jgi:hypothetical protein
LKACSPGFRLAKNAAEKRSQAEAQAWLAAHDFLFDLFFGQDEREEPMTDGMFPPSHVISG